MDPSAEVILASVDLSEFGARVRDARRSKAMTQDDLAGKDFTSAYVSRIENGQRRPEPGKARLIAERLGVTLDFLVTGVEPQRAEETRLAVRYAELALKSGEAQDAETQLRKLLATPDDLGSYRHEAMRLHALSLEATGHPDEAVSLLETLVTHPDGSPDLLAALALCRIYRELGDLGLAVEIGERACKLAVDSGLEGTDDEIRLAVTLVGAFWKRGDLARAAHLCRDVVARAEQRGSAPARGAAYWNASLVAADRGHHVEAVELADRALALFSEGDDARNLARLRTLLGLMSLQPDALDLDAARAHLSRACDELQATDGSPVDIARCREGLAQVSLLSGDEMGAIDGAREALDLVKSVSPFVSASAEMTIGRAKFAMGDETEARQHFITAAGLLTAAQADRDVGQLWLDLGELLRATGDADGALDAYRRATASLGLWSTLPTAARTPSI